MRRKLATADARVAAIAARQHGVVSIAQLLWAGLSEAGVRRRVAAGRLHRIHRGVYAVGHAGLSDRGRWMAATLACGDGCALSHRSAAELWGMLDVGGSDVHVTIPRAGGRAVREGIRLHRSRTLVASLVTRKDNIPLTRPRRTLEDLRHQLTLPELRGAVRKAEIAGLPLDGFDLLPHLPESELELCFLRLCRDHGIRKPETQVRIGRYRIDFLWRAETLIVETDGYRYHRGAVAFEADRTRDNYLVGLGFQVLRFSYRRVVEEPQAVAALVRAELARRS
jgi:very-short-patch-repair endonuclease